VPRLDDAYVLARWLTGSPADSEDVVQDACLRALRAIGTFSDGNARAWMLTIVRNTTYSWTMSHSESTRRNAAPAEDLGQRGRSPPRIRHGLTTDQAN
jgi:RNA polymerase sigma-70 factor (ECF subfamily)